MYHCVENVKKEYLPRYYTEIPADSSSTTATSTVISNANTLVPSSQVATNFQTLCLHFMFPNYFI